MTDTQKQHCVWTEDADCVWDTDCGERFGFVEGDPEKNNFAFCCFCGNALLAEPLTEDDA
jgi:hypothetical protein